MAIEILSFPIQNGGSFHSYVNVYQRVRDTVQKFVVGDFVAPFCNGFFCRKPAGMCTELHGAANQTKSQSVSNLSNPLLAALAFHPQKQWISEKKNYVTMSLGRSSSFKGRPGCQCSTCWISQASHGLIEADGLFPEHRWLAFEIQPVERWFHPAINTCPCFEELPRRVDDTCVPIFSIFQYINHDSHIISNPLSTNHTCVYSMK